VNAPHGPHRIGRNRQVALPAELMTRVHLRPGDGVYLQVSDDPPGALLVIPLEVATKWFEAGRKGLAHGADDEALPVSEA
jgi:antitoxin component of MazEF toxin-antitoxin module